MFAHGNVSRQLFLDILDSSGYFWGPWVTFVTADELSVSVTKITSKIGVSWTHSLPFCFYLILTQWIMVILSKGCKPDNFESYNALKLSFMNILGLHSNFDGCKSFLESNSADILALFETNQDDSIDSSNLSVRGYLPLIWNDSTTHMHGLSVYVKWRKDFLLHGIYLEKTVASSLCFWLALLHSVSSFFFLYQSPLSLCTVLILVHLTWMRFSRSTHLLMCLSLEILMSIIRTG